MRKLVQLAVIYNILQYLNLLTGTGSGKSTLILGLLRLLELTEYQNKLGAIHFDSIDISTLGLHELRKRVTIIPQDPILLEGTIRKNLDPLGQYNDEDIVKVLKKVFIWDQLQSIQGNDYKILENTKIELCNNGNLLNSQTEIQQKLNFQVSECGMNFSQGQRQLISLARALLRKSRILLMDEATSSIDGFSDNIIQRILREEYRDTTVVAIAHRIQTIILYDKIIVLNKGRIVECGKPKTLIDQKGEFCELIKENGVQFQNKMIELLNKQQN